MMQPIIGYHVHFTRFHQSVQAMRDFEGREVTKVRYAPANIKHRIPDEEWSVFDESSDSGEMDNKRLGKWHLRKAN